MKKLLVVVSLMCVMVGCSSYETKSKNNIQDNIIPIEVSTDIKLEESKEHIEDVMRQDDLTTINVIDKVISEPLGDRTSDNYSADNGEYFAIGSDIVKCSDYENIHIVVELTNNRDELFNTNIMAWSAKMEDGYNLRFNTSDYSNIQIQSGSTAKIELDILKEKIVKGNAIILTYTDINYDNTYTEFFQKVLSGVSEEECKKEYPQFFDESLSSEMKIELH